MKNKTIKLLTIILIIIMITGVICMFQITGNTSNKNYDYSIHFQEGTNTYIIYKIKNKIEVYSEEQVICVKTPCPTIEKTEKIKFSKDNMIIIDNFIDNCFKNHDDNSIEIFRENLSNSENKILDSIIYNNEKLLNE